MISDGRTVFQGEVAKIRATRGDELILRPETESSLASLLTLAQGAGFALLAAHTCRRRDVTA
jgi:hypothetical protein